MTTYIGEIRLSSCSFVPAGWAQCDGQILPIEGNRKIYEAIGTTFGGDGKNNFALPDLRGRVLMGAGTNGDESYAIGDSGGLEKVRLTTDQIAPHSHLWPASDSPGQRETPAKGYLARFHEPATGAIIAAYAPTTDGTALSRLLGERGEDDPHTNMQPFLVLKYFIAIDDKEGKSHAAVGDIRLSTTFYVPRDWSLCDGSTLSIAKFPRLFTQFGTVFGGDGVQNFTIPDLRHRLAVGAGISASGTRYAQGVSGGLDEVKLTHAEMPRHSHRIMVNSAAAVSESPADAFLAAPQSKIRVYADEKPKTGLNATGAAGGFMAHDNHMPSVAVDYIVSEGGYYTPPFIGEIRAFAHDAIPKNWLPCDGRFLDILAYSALYSVFETRYGGRKGTEFALPDLRGVTVMGTGSSEARSTPQGKKMGTAKVTLAEDQIPAHVHQPLAVSAPTAPTNVPSAKSVLTVASTTKGKPIFAYQDSNEGKPMAAKMVEPVGGSEPHENRQPFLAVTFAVCFDGVYMPRP